MADETRVVDQTRRLLKVFGVKLTDYEEKTAALLSIEDGQAMNAEIIRRAAEAVALTEDLNQHLRHITDHVTQSQNRVLAQVKEALERASQ